MANRSLKASDTGIARAKQAFARTGWTQEYLAAQVGLSTRQSVWKFFSGRPIERHLFIDICFQLDLDWEEIVDLPQFLPSTSSSIGLSKLEKNPEADELTQKLRTLLEPSIKSQCSTLQSSFDVSQFLQLEQIYTHVHIFPHLSNQRWLEVLDLQNSFSSQERSNLNQSDRQTILGMDAIDNASKLVILGKPGAGKTTFLQYIALQCIEGKYKADCLPILITLRTIIDRTKESQELSLFNYISRVWDSFGICGEQITALLKNGKLLILLDGLDEVPDREGDRGYEQISKQIQEFAEIYYQNQIIVTCRLAAQQYHFRGFNHVELADFDRSQIETFAQKWFIATNSSQTKGINKAKQFLEQLQRRENYPIRELLTTPILLNLVCSVFQERSTFPSKRFKLYQEGLDILLVRWDRARGIQRDLTYYNLSLPDKIKLLSQIASVTFEEGNYFLEKSEILQIIADYLLTLPNTDRDPETLRLDSEAILQAIEVQHGLLVERARGIYSFSHLTFQEYLTARKIVASPDPQTLDRSLKQLATHVTETQWREVILLTASMLPNADLLVQTMKERLDRFLAAESYLQDFLCFLEEKVNSIKFDYQSAAVRAFYFGLFQNRDLTLAMSLDTNLANNLSGEIGLDLALARSLAMSLTLIANPQLKQILNFSFALEFERSFTLDKQLKQALEELKEQLLDPSQGKNSLLAWWQTNGRDWVKNFQSLILKHRYFGQEWHFDSQQQELLQQYYKSNQFLVECLNSDSKITPALQAKIVATLLLPTPIETASVQDKK